MATTTPDNIQYPVNSDQVAPLASHFKNLADTTQTALNGKASTAAVNAKVAKAGDTMTGALVLSGDPTLALHAATKQYVDAADTALQNQITSNLQTSRMYVKNGTTALTKGTPVYITGANGTNVIVGAASNVSEAKSSKVIGLLESDLAINAMGYVVTAGLCTNIDTSAAGSAGDPVWLGVDGEKIYGLANKPYAPAHLVYLGVVTKKNGSTGEIEVRVQNGFELEELHNVQINSLTLATGQALTYDASTSLWKNSTPVSSLAGLSDVTLTDPVANEVLKYDGTDWVNGTAAGGVTAAATAPDLVEAKLGDAWFDTNDGTLYVCYIDPDSTKQWVQVQANSALEGSILARLGSLESQSIAFGALSPNYIINGAMDIWQRGTSFSNPSDGAYVVDRWVVNHNGTGATRTVSQQTFTPGAAPIAGYEGTYFLRYDTSVIGSGNTYQVISQRIEDVRTLAGQTATISFWAKGSASRSCFVQAAQVFNGGSSTVYTVAGTASVTTGWQRFSFTINVPSMSGKTINSGSYLAIELHAGGATSGQLDIWGVQLEKGNTATAFRRNQPNIQAELAACQRYYVRINQPSNGNAYGWAGSGWAYVSTGDIVSVALPVPMRIPPTSRDVGGIWSTQNTSNATFALSALNLNTSEQSTTMASFVTARASGASSVWCRLQAYNDTTAYIGLSAEL